MKYAAEIAQASDFIEAKPSKFESPVSQDGTNVSGRSETASFDCQSYRKETEGFSLRRQLFRTEL